VPFGEQHGSSYEMSVIGIKVISCKSIHDFDAIIGMDIIAKGDFAITGKSGNTKFSFRMPSIADIDFTSHHP
jgi:hypothetical protein